MNSKLSPFWQQLHKLKNWLKSDFGVLFGTLSRMDRNKPGLYTYRENIHGYSVRIHLRVEDSGSGVLFVDVTDAIHLNPSAVTIVKWALEGVDRDVAIGKLLRLVSHRDRQKISRDIDQLYGLVNEIKSPTEGCHTCDIPYLQRARIFTTPVSAPFKVDLAITYGCNNKCSHCYNEPDRFEMPVMDLNSWKRVVDKIVQIGVPHIILTGGEATLYPELPAVIRYIDENGPIVGLNTNGRRLADDGYSNALKNAGLNHVQITLGSCYEDVHNQMMGARAYQQTVRGIENALESGIHTITNTTLMKGNIQHVEEIIQFIYALGIRTFAMNGMIHAGGGKANPDALDSDEISYLLVNIQEQAQKLDMRFLWYTPTEYCIFSPLEIGLEPKRCNAGEYSICIEPNGDVLPCQSYYQSVGNILKDSWADIWHSDLFVSFRDREVNPVIAGLPEKCWTCVDLDLCGGGCRLEQEARLNSGVVQTAGGGCPHCFTRVDDNRINIGIDTQVECKNKSSRRGNRSVGG